MPTAQVFLSQAQAFLEGLFRTAIAAREDEGDRPPVCTKNLNPHIMMMKPAKDRVGKQSAANQSPQQIPC
jgi:hypothetical protein